MVHAARRVLALSLLALAAPACATTPDPDGPAVAITFDDIPIHGPLPDGETRVGVVRAIAGTLRAAGVVEAYGFVNAAGIAGDPALAETLTVWRAAGYPLGNHGWSHANLDAVPVDTYTDEIARGEPTIAGAMGEGDWRWYRFPFLAEGSDPAIRLAVRRFLAARHYRVAAVTLSFDDYLWNEPYARCRAAGDEAGVAELERTYLAAARESLAAARTASRALYGRDIPYVLLMHVGAFDARMLPRLLDLYREAGVRFIPLAEAERDPAYAADTDLALPPRPGGLEARLAAAGREVPPRLVYAEQLDDLCR